jgi:hypothetical protein
MGTVIDGGARQARPTKRARGTSLAAELLNDQTSAQAITSRYMALQDKFQVCVFFFF